MSVQSEMRRVRSGRHITQIGNVWYYRRVVPPDVRDVFGVSKVKKSLDTSSETEAKRLEKIKDVEFEERLRGAREAGLDGYSRDPQIRTEQMVGEVYSEYDRANPVESVERAIAGVPAQYREDVRKRIDQYEGNAAETDEKIDQFWQEELRDLLFESALDADDWPTIRSEIAGLLRDHAKQVSTEHTLDWAYVQWTKAANRPQQTVDEASRYLDDFKRFAHVRMLSGVRRSHLTTWRDELKKLGTPEAVTIAEREARKLSPKSINHRLEIVSAILRTGWREAPMVAPDISKINLPESLTSSRGAWNREDILKELGELEPHSGAAWVFVIGLTTSTRLGETVAARKGWYNRNGFIEVPAEYTKMKKPHVLPIIDLIREPFIKHIEGLKADDYMFDVPRPMNPKLKISHEASKWFSRFHAKHHIRKVIHELRHSWIAAARYESPIKEEVWEIISGHSKKTVADGYGGEKPLALMKANETICEHLLDVDLRAAILRLIG